MQRWLISRRGRRRLQRDKDFTGERLSSFRDVFLRHGLPGLALAILFLIAPSLQSVLIESLSSAAAHPIRYMIGFAIILAALALYVRRIEGQWRLTSLGWVLYLGALSFWEEWVFRLAIPQVLEQAGLSVWGAVLLSAVGFGVAHYFTLRWKWQYCVGACFGGLYFSHQIEMHGNLLLVVAIHWVATTVNTPRLPAQKEVSETEE